MKKILTLITLITVFTISSQAQSAIGVRLGGYNGVTFRTPIQKFSHLEIMAALPFNGNGIYATILGEKQSQFDANFGWYWGVGGHVGLFEESTVIGADFILGLDFVIPNSPINLSADWKPAIDLVGDTRFRSSNGAISVRYMF